MRYRPFSGTRAVVALMLREMATTYGRSPGGYIWVIVEPIAGIALLTLAFSVMLRSPPLGSNFPLFYASGFLPFGIYQGIAGKVGSSIRYSRPLLAYPAVTYIDTIVSRFLLTYLTNLLIFVLVVGAIIAIYEVDILLDVGRLANGFVMVALLALGVGLVNAYLSGLFPVWEHVWGIINRPLFLLSGLFYLVDSLPGPIRDLMLWNPLVHVIMEVRAGIYPMYDGRFVSSLYVYGISVILIFFGFMLLHRHHRYLMSEGA